MDVGPMVYGPARAQDLDVTFPFSQEASKHGHDATHTAAAQAALAAYAKAAAVAAAADAAAATAQEAAAAAVAHE